MATLPDSGSDGGFFLLKGSFFVSTVHAQDGGLDQREVLMQTFFFLNWHYMNWTGLHSGVAVSCVT